MAVRTGSPIYVDERVLDEAGVEPDASDEEGGEDEERLAVFREFVNSLDVDLESGEKGPPAEESAAEPDCRTTHSASQGLNRGFRSRGCRACDVWP